MAPCKPAPNDYFVAIFQVAPNRLKFGMCTLFIWPSKIEIPRCLETNREGGGRGG